MTLRTACRRRPRHRPRPEDPRSESSLQQALIAWAWSQPAWRRLFAIPNGGWRHPRTAARLRAEGVQAGLPDLCLPAAHGGAFGLFLEMKSARGRVTPAQAAWHTALRAAGYAVVVCRTLDEAQAALRAYSTLPLTRPANRDAALLAMHCLTRRHQT